MPSNSHLKYQPAPRHEQCNGDVVAASGNVTSTSSSRNSLTSSPKLSGVYVGAATSPAASSLSSTYASAKSPNSSSVYVGVTSSPGVASSPSVYSGVTSPVVMAPTYCGVQSNVMSHDLEGHAGDPAEVQFLQQSSSPSSAMSRSHGLAYRFSNREKYLVAVTALLFCACVAFAVVAFVRDRQGQKWQNYCFSAQCVKTAAHLMEGMDMTVDPCEDFAKYACGNWNRKHVIPEDKSSYNTFEKLYDDLQITLKGVLEEPLERSESSAEYKAKIFYRSCINVTEIETVGDWALKEVLENMGGWPVLEDAWDPQNFNMESLLGKVTGIYNVPGVLISFWVGADDKNSTVNIIQLDQQVLGMPSRDYYLHDQGSQYFQAYYKYMVEVARLLLPPGPPLDPPDAMNLHDEGPPPLEEQLQDVLEFETQLANLTKPQAEKHDTGAMYNKVTIEELYQTVPNFDWLTYFNALLPVQVTRDEPVVVFALDYLKDMADLVIRTDPRTVANYIVWRVIMYFGPHLTEAYLLATNNYRKVLHGVEREKIRWQRCVDFINRKMGMAVGAMFIRDNFRKESKVTALEMIHDIREAFNELLEENDWMDMDTKAVAKEKANAMNERIGYPDFIIDKDKLDEKYDTLEFLPGHYLKNILRLDHYRSIKMMENLRRPVQKDVWDQEPAIVNAFYNPNTNDIVFPAAIFQPPFYSEHYPKSLNYGGIGMVIGHEITHGFDDKGRQYDKEGNMKQWWKNETIEAFRERAQCMVDQYSTYKLEQIDMFIDGKNTQGENIADNGGLKQAYRAYRKWVEKNGEEPLLPGINLNHNQLFFLNYAQIWCGKMRDAEALHKIRTSVHSPGSIRILGPLSNSRYFSEAFRCPLGSRMNPEHKCTIW